MGWNSFIINRPAVENRPNPCYLGNEFNSYPSYTHITWVEAVYAI